MGNILGFLLINAYAFLVILSISIIFFTKKRSRQFEDETYKKFLLSTVFISLSGIILGFAVNPSFNVNPIFIVILNKIYLVCLILWISVMTFYFMIISLKNKINEKKVQKIFGIIELISILLIIVLPIDVSVSTDGAVAGGAAIMFAYLVFAVGFITQLVCVFANRKNFKSKKYVPLYAFILFGSVAIGLVVINPALNYILNPVFVFIAFIMYHTIENPDVQMIETLLRNKELVEQTVNDKSNFLFKVSQEMKKPVKNIIDNSKLYKESKSVEEKNYLIDLIERDANNAYFIINDITSISSTDFKNIKMQNNEYMTKKLFTDIKVNANNKLKLAKKDEVINFRFKNYDSYPERLCGDNLKLKQVILSIISNSIKYTDSGFIDVEVDTITRYDICRLVFTIKDSGCGMSISKVNELLSSADEIDAKWFEKIDNLDLQIPVVIKIIKLLGGSISIKSEEGKGTIVVIVIDQKIKSDNISIGFKNNKKYNMTIKSRKRILVADDTPNLERIERLLLKYDVDVISTLVGRECIDKINSGDNFDLIILKDDMKPDNAYMILKELKENKKFKIPVVIMIDKDKEFIKDHFIEDGFSDCIIYENIDNEVKEIANKYL